MLVVVALQLVDDAAQPLGGGQDGIIGDPLALVDIVVDSDAQALAEQLFLAAEIIIDRRPVERSEEHTSELQSLMRISYAVFCLKKKKHTLHQIQSQYNIQVTIQSKLLLTSTEHK